jgi:hypothetical protein
MKWLKWLRNLRLTALAALAILALGAGIASSALATGQPGAKAENFCGEGTAEMTPGGSEAAGGSPFNPKGRAGEVYAGNPETQSLKHSARPEIAESQYDVACLQVTSHTK